jgi:hypothetical protein
VLAPLPSSFAATRQALHAIACYAIAPARKAATGRIGLHPVHGGFGTPPLPDGSVIRVRDDRLQRIPGPALDVAITTVRAACEALDVEPVADPGVGTDLPPFEPDAQLQIDLDAAAALAAWYAFVDDVLTRAHAQLPPTMSPAQLWPEHFDYAADWGRDDEHRMNLGGSPGDTYSAEPYLYAGPWDRDLLASDPAFWNAPFGRTIGYAELLAASEPERLGTELFTAAAARLG